MLRSSLTHEVTNVDVLEHMFERVELVVSNYWHEFQQDMSTKIAPTHYYNENHKASVFCQELEGILTYMMYKLFGFVSGRLKR